MKFSLATISLLATAGSAAAFVQPSVASRGSSSSAKRTPPRFMVVSDPASPTSEKTKHDAPASATAATGVKTEGMPPLSVVEKKAEEAVPAAPAKEESSAPVEKKAPELAAVAAAAPVPPIVDAKAQIVPGRYNNIDYSITLPFFQRPPKLDGTHAGDYGFDPMGFNEDYDIYYLQECELRHARLAMLAAAGWPLSEMLAPGFMLQDGGRAPSVLNGFNPISAVAVLGILGAFGYFEYTTALRRTADTELGRKHRKDMEQVWEFGVAGDYNFDPMGLYSLLGDDAAGRRAMRSVEISHGRWAMVGITGFAMLEALSGKAIVEDNLFFHPNPVLPLVALSYFLWSQFYQISDVREYPIRIEYTKDGEEKLRSIKRTFSQVEEE